MEQRLGTSADAAHELGIEVEAFKKRHTRKRLPFQPVGRLGGYHVWDLDEVRRHKNEGEA
ncbi:hypothetical protein [Nocardioides sp.]|uniref:hypothetical protein n=1 Tax=Nocardioides sp. TaxID=35761 RepID=UPI002C031A01|nr:hypothetical protein [Nocardioides sp.]HSX68459.1 hypothetical protein [Nocardioides sp.]